MDNCDFHAILLNLPGHCATKASHKFNKNFASSNQKLKDEPGPGRKLVSQIGIKKKM